jgi:hypothetical protein
MLMATGTWCAAARRSKPTRRLPSRATGTRAHLGFAGLLLILALAGCRPTPAPPGALPWGALHLDQREPPAAVRPVAASAAGAGWIDRLPLAADGKRLYPILTVSGGGSYVAFAAGFVTGWSEAGDRPAFRIVTGMSGGVLVALYAFLGPAWDDELLALFDGLTTEQVYRLDLWTPLRATLGSAAADFGPGRALIERQVTPRVVEAVAAAHREGRRLYFITANMDTNAATLWDMGAIAASGRPDRLQRFRDVIEAAVAIPGLFPPKFFPVEVDGRVYGQMHMDAQTDFVFLRDFMAWTDAEIAARSGRGGEIRQAIFALQSVHALPRPQPPPAAWAPLLARRAIERIGHYAAYGALDRLYLYALAHGAEFHAATLPDAFDPGMHYFAFEPEGIRRLLEFGRARALSRERWSSQPAEPPHPRPPAAPLFTYLVAVP